jgi:mannitol/fructose-specific phosphotransferase system IIA component
VDVLRATLLAGHDAFARRHRQNISPSTELQDDYCQQIWTRESACQTYIGQNLFLRVNFTSGHELSLTSHLGSCAFKVFI